MIYDPLVREIAWIDPHQTHQKIVFTTWPLVEFDACNNMHVSKPAYNPNLGWYIAIISLDKYLPLWYDTYSKPEATLEGRQATAKSLVHADTFYVDCFDGLSYCNIGIDDNEQQGQNVTLYEFDVLDN